MGWRASVNIFVQMFVQVGKGVLHWEESRHSVDALLNICEGFQSSCVVELVGHRVKPVILLLECFKNQKQNT